MIKNDLTGKQFNKWKVIKLDYERTNSSRGVYYICECQCDNKTIKSIYASNLTSNKTKSCGCLKRENVSKANHKTNKYNINNEYGIGYSNNNEEFYFDLEDYDKIKDYCWHVNNYGYLVSGSNILHRVVMDAKDNDLVIDHIDHNKLDCRKQNLRECSISQNAMNMIKPSRNTSGCKGVSYHKYSNTWRAFITKNKKQIYLGYYKLCEDAVKARKDAEVKYFGKYNYETEVSK